MKTRSIILCALVLLTSSALLFAQKTEVTVRQGKVRAETQTATVNVDAGQKVVLKKGVNPLVTVDSPLVHDALELYKLVEKEKEHGELKIDSVLIMVGKVDEDEVVAAIYFEVPNPMPKATNIMTFPYSSTLGYIRVYDLNGNLCQVEEKSLGDFAFSFSIHFLEQVQPGEHFKFIAVTSLDDIDMPVFPGGARLAWKDGPLAYFRWSPGNPNALTGTFPLPPGYPTSYRAPLCLLPDTTPDQFVYAECEAGGDEIWNRKYWDDLDAAERLRLEEAWKWETVFE